nr:CMRF35-like molecule 9 [Danio rerio]|eukprot:XP_021333860.1 CMRF35-like molecule 9 [Danio rerio]
MKIIWTFTLLMIPAACCQKSISLSAAAGGSVNISCRYPQSHTADVKFICRRSGADLCAEETRSEEESGGRKAEGKIQLYDDREEQLLTATISHESPEHSAEYWCGVQSAGHKSFITRVFINFTDAGQTLETIRKVLSSYVCEILSDLIVLFSNAAETPPSSPPTSSTSLSKSASSPPNSSSPPPPSSSSASLSDSSSSSAKTSLSSSPKTSPYALIPASPNTSAGSSLIIPLVLVVLLLIIAALLLLFLYKKHQTKGGDSQTGPGNTAVVSHTACDYEEIKDTHKQLPTNPSESSSAVYSTAELPTKPSESSSAVYATAQLPTNPSESFSSVYATAQLPNNPSDSCLYSTVQEASGDSQICISSAEGLNYSVVNFHKTPDLRNSQECSEYAAVNHNFTA